MTKRKVSNPLALAVLSCLIEKPCHPYEMATTMRSRGQDDSIKLNYGSLYTVVQSLQRHGLIVPLEAEREGRRPERTVYHLTDAGRLELVDWLSELLSTPVKEYYQFEAGLSLIACLPPSDAVQLLRQRCMRLELEIGRTRSMVELIRAKAVPRIFLIEVEHRLALHQAELDWTQSLASEIEHGTIEGIEGWSHFHGQTVATSRDRTLDLIGPGDEQRNDERGERNSPGEAHQ